jgi:hypothetical protein
MRIVVVSRGKRERTSTMSHSPDWRQRLYIIIFHTDTPAGQRFDRWLLLIILASLVVVMFDSVDRHHQRFGDLFMALEWGFTTLFAIEYALCLYCSPKPLRYAYSFYGLIDLLAVLPALLALLFADAQYLLIIRVIRMLRVFRVLKLSPYLRQANFLLTALRGSRQKIIVFFVGIAILVTVYGTHPDVRDRKPCPWLHQYSQGHLLGGGDPDHRRLRRHSPAYPAGPGAGDPGDDHRLLDHRRADRDLYRRTGHGDARRRSARA